MAWVSVALSGRARPQRRGDLRHMPTLEARGVDLVLARLPVTVISVFGEGRRAVRRAAGDLVHLQCYWQPHLRNASCPRCAAHTHPARRLRRHGTMRLRHLLAGCPRGAGLCALPCLFGRRRAYPGCALRCSAPSCAAPRACRRDSRLPHAEQQCRLGARTGRNRRDRGCRGLARSFTPRSCYRCCCGHSCMCAQGAVRLKRRLRDAGRRSCGATPNASARDTGSGARSLASS